MLFYPDYKETCKNDNFFRPINIRNIFFFLNFNLSPEIPTVEGAGGRSPPLHILTAEACSVGEVPWPVTFVLVRHFVFRWVVALGRGNMQQRAQQSVSQTL
jgi:hypothetical protein